MGIILTCVPWTGFWERNYFAQSLPLLHAAMRNDFVRGAVSGVGVLNILAGVAEMRNILLRQRQ